MSEDFSDSGGENFSDVFTDEEDYNSEDDEFLAYHDADIEAQVRDCLQKMQKRKDEAELRNVTLMERTDRQAVERVRLEQVQMLGGCERLYHQADINLRQHRFQPYLAEDQYKLYTWRENFFHLKFPEDTWFTDGGDDSHYHDTVPYQITKNWEEVVSLACCPDKEGNRVYFENNESLSSKAKYRFDKTVLIYDDGSFLDRMFLDDEGISFADVSHMIGAVYPRAPPRLEQLAIRCCLVHRLNMDEVPRSLQKKSEVGFCDLTDPAPTHLTSQGRDSYHLLRTEFGCPPVEGIESD